ncbi:MAG TPA: hypothetical protein VD862_00525 [Candidatus Paceibacterota bacterium]|nr:hypothetical protein [Candidatus Paceibacterota bacterium]
MKLFVPTFVFVLAAAGAGAQTGEESGSGTCPPGFDCTGVVVRSATPIRDSIPGAVSRAARDLPTVRVRREHLELCPAGFVRCVERESFWSPTNLLLTSFQWGGAFYDSKTTMNADALNGSYEVTRDGRPVRLVVTVREEAGPEQWFIDRGPVALGGYKALYNVPFAVASHKLRQSNSSFGRVVGYAVPIVLGALQWKAGLDNKKEIDRINGLIAP